MMMMSGEYKDPLRVIKLRWIVLMSPCIYSFNGRNQDSRFQDLRSLLSCRLLWDPEIWSMVKLKGGISWSSPLIGRNHWLIYFICIRNGSKVLNHLSLTATQKLLKFQASLPKLRGNMSTAVSSVFRIGLPFAVPEYIEKGNTHNLGSLDHGTKWCMLIWRGL